MRSHQIAFLQWARVCDAIDSNTPNSIVRSARIEASIDRIFGDIFCTPNTKCTTHHCGRRRRTASASCPSSEQSGGEERPAEATVEEMAQISFLWRCLSNSLFPSLPPSLSLRRRFQPPSNPLSLSRLLNAPPPPSLPSSLSLSLSLSSLWLWKRSFFSLHPWTVYAHKRKYSLGNPFAFQETAQFPSDSEIRTKNTLKSGHFHRSCWLSRLFIHGMHLSRGVTCSLNEIFKHEFKNIFPQNLHLMWPQSSKGWKATYLITMEHQTSRDISKSPFISPPLFFIRRLHSSVILGPSLEAINRTESKQTKLREKMRRIAYHTPMQRQDVSCAHIRRHEGTQHFNGFLDKNGERNLEWKGLFWFMSQKEAREIQRYRPLTHQRRR